MTTTSDLLPVDYNALRTNQALIITLLIVAFVASVPALALFVGLVMAVGALVGAPGFKPVYKYIVKPLGIKPDVMQDNPEPHRFAQALGAVFVLAGSVALFAGLPVLGWALSWLVVALAALNLFGGFCVGCFFYYWFGRLHMPGFNKTPPLGTTPGMRPHGE